MLENTNQFCFLECEVKVNSDDPAQSTDPQMSTRERQLALQVKEALASSVRLELYPKTMIHISIIVLACHDHNHELSLCINAASIALVDAGVEVKDIVTASTLVVPNSRHEPVAFTVAEMSKCGVMTLLLSEGMVTDNMLALSSYVAQIQATCQKMRKVIDEYFFRKFTAASKKL
jgi:ribonuclease PH